MLVNEVQKHGIEEECEAIKPASTGAVCADVDESAGPRQKSNGCKPACVDPHDGVVNRYKIFKHPVVSLPQDKKNEKSQAKGDELVGIVGQHAEH